MLSSHNLLFVICTLRFGSKQFSLHKNAHWIEIIASKSNTFTTNDIYVEFYSMLVLYIWMTIYTDITCSSDLMFMSENVQFGCTMYIRFAHNFGTQHLCISDKRKCFYCFCHEGPGLWEQWYFIVIISFFYNLT